MIDAHCRIGWVHLRADDGRVIDHGYAPFMSADELEVWLAGYGAYMVGLPRYYGEGDNDGDPWMVAVGVAAALVILWFASSMLWGWPAMPDNGALLR